jgi:hypothetical protein
LITWSAKAGVQMFNPYLYRRLFIGAAALCCSIALVGCERTVEWQEEVPLNTGEVIWIKRRVDFELRGGFSNPFDIGLRPSRVQEIRFEYSGQQYAYRGRANVILLAVSPAKLPTLVAPAADFAWDEENRYFCVIPFYVQLVSDSSGSTWNWPPKPEAWLYGMPANVMQSIPKLDEHRKARYGAMDRSQRDETYRLQFPPGARIDPTYSTNNCVRGQSNGQQ